MEQCRRVAGPGAAAHASQDLRPQSRQLGDVQRHVRRQPFAMAWLGSTCLQRPQR
jgi:hypothetical protein